MISMEEEKIVKLFLENGFQLSKSALSVIPADPEPVIAELKKIKPRPFIVTDEHIKKFLKTINFSPIKIAIIKEFTVDKTPLHVNDCVKHFLSRYEKIKTILIKQISLKGLVSLNKITTKTKEFSVIGVVREKNNNSILVEDPTGETNLHFDDDIKEELNHVLPDDVVGFQCEKIREKYYVKKLIYPDVLSSRDVTKTKEDILITFITSTQTLSNSQTKKLVDYLSGLSPPPAVFIFDQINSHFLSNTSVELNLTKVSFGVAPKLFQLDTIKVLTLPSQFINNYLSPSLDPEVLTSILKRRELIVGSPHIYNVHEDFVLQEVPDIIFSNFGRSIYMNYKGTTLISNSDPEKIFTVNLKTRDVEQFSL